MNDIPLQQKKYTVSIEYCVPCDYSQQVLRVTQALVRHYQHVIDRLELVMGSNGTFDIAVDGEIVFSKAEAGRFPEEDEVLSLFEQAVGTAVERYSRS